jgi:hypothetical protein
MPDTKVAISEHDKHQLRDLAIGAAEEFMSFGSPSTYIERACAEAFQLGFTCVGRGEAEGQEHPGLPDYMLPDPEESAPAVFE